MDKSYAQQVQDITGGHPGANSIVDQLVQDQGPEVLEALRQAQVSAQTIYGVGQAMAQAGGTCEQVLEILTGKK